MSLFSNFSYPGNIKNVCFLLFYTILEIYGTSILHIFSYPGNIEHLFSRRAGGRGRGVRVGGRGSGAAEPTGGPVGGTPQRAEVGHLF